MLLTLLQLRGYKTELVRVSIVEFRSSIERQLRAIIEGDIEVYY